MALPNGISFSSSDSFDDDLVNIMPIDVLGDNPPVFEWEVDEALPLENGVVEVPQQDAPVDADAPADEDAPAEAEGPSGPLASSSPAHPHVVPPGEEEGPLVIRPLDCSVTTTDTSSSTMSSLSGEEVSRPPKRKAAVEAMERMSALKRMKLI